MWHSGKAGVQGCKKGLTRQDFQTFQKCLNKVIQEPTRLSVTKEESLGNGLSLSFFFLKNERQRVLKNGTFNMEVNGPLKSDLYLRDND